MATGKAPEIKMDHINSLKPFEIADDQKVHDRFVWLHSALYPDLDAEEFYQQQKYFFNKLLVEKNTGNKPITGCTPFSLYCCFMDIVTLNATFDPAAKQVYILQRGYPTGRKYTDGQGKEKEVYENRAYNQLSPYGELAQRIMAKQIRYVDPVVIVYDDDTWKIKMDDGSQIRILFEATIPRTSKEIKGSFMKTTREDGSFFFTYMLKEEIQRLAAYSERANSYGNKKGDANALYSSVDGGIDPGFLEAKTLKHSFKTLPKLKISATNTELDDLPEHTPGEQQENGSSPDMPSFKPVAENGSGSGAAAVVVAEVIDTGNIQTEMPSEKKAVDLALDF